MGKSQSTIHAASSGGVAGEHADPSPFQILAGSSTGDEFNTAHLPLIPVACWAIDDIRFAFDSSFVDADCSGGGNEPEDIRVELNALASLVAKYPQCPLSLWGHADPEGSDVYNKSLSERRARAIYALIIFKSEPDLAVSYWQTIAGAESWGSLQQQRMQSLTGGTGSASDDGLIRAYLKTLSDPAPVLSKTDFLAQGAGTDRKGDFQGCSEFNPLIIFSQEKQAQFDQAEQNKDQAAITDRNSQNAPNRRVLGLLFRKGSRVDPVKWPCPRAPNISGCINRFWSDGETRRSTHLSGIDRTFDDKQDTFACRFYQRIACLSPCERNSPFIILTIRLFDPFTVHIPDSPYRITVGPQVFQLKAGSDGFVHLKVAEIPDSCLVEWAHEEDSYDDYAFSRTIYLKMDGLAQDEEVKRRLHNLGYEYEDPEAGNVTAFQRDYSLTQTGQASDIVATLRQWYGDPNQVEERPRVKGQTA